ncbi:MAG: DNA-binding Lrp family transcriptional regulator [Granulosicoccus sp.]|jgi:DNA-binding Lrp family transcriptional regulator
MDYKIDAIDKRIIQLLQQDGKMKIKEVAHALKMTTTPIFDRIKRLEREGFIEGYSTIVNKEKLGFNLVAFCTVSLESHHKEYLNQFVKGVKNIPEVAECYHIAGMFDYLLKVYVKDMVDYQNFITQKLASLPNIGRVQSSFVMTEVKNNHVLPI